MLLSWVHACGFSAAVGCLQAAVHLSSSLVLHLQCDTFSSYQIQCGVCFCDCVCVCVCVTEREREREREYSNSPLFSNGLSLGENFNCVPSFVCRVGTPDLVTD